jgi:hypothetical protein
MGSTLLHEQSENNVEHTKKSERLEQLPNITQYAAIVAHFKLGPSHGQKKTPDITEFKLLIHL